VGANNTILMAASGEATGLKWATPAVTMAALSAGATAAFSLNSQNLTAVGTIGSGAITSTAGITAGSNIVSDTDDTDDLGTSAVRWKNIYLSREAKLDSAPDTDHTVSGLTVLMKAHEAVVYGDACYLNSDSEMAKALATAEATSRVVGVCADSAGIAANATGTFLLQGFFRHDADNWTPGAKVYLSDDTAGLMDATAPAATTNYCTVILGIAYTADVLYFNPQLVIVEHT
jgi:hypothetical protein